jgi:uncharacterized protein (DUF342 family)
MKRAIVVAALGTALGFSISAHAADASKRAAACNDLMNLHSSVQQLSQLDSQATKTDAEKAEDQVTTNYKALRKSATKVAKPQMQNLESSLHNLRAAIEKAPTSATLGQSQAVIKGAASQVKIADKQLSDALGCAQTPDMGTSDTQPTPATGTGTP